MIQIRFVDKKTRKETDRFVEKEWTQFDKDVGYEYEVRKHEIIAVKKDKIVGYVEYEIVGGVSRLSQLIVSKDARKEGIGSELLAFYEKDSKGRGCHLCYLETSENHTSALSFYKNKGYKIIATLPKHKFRVTWYIYGKELTK
jgi:ribosomal protein S18 acetylase RimI-like enzyme